MTRFLNSPSRKPGTNEGGEEGGRGGSTSATYEHLGEDILSTIKVETIGYEGMRIDREFYAKFEDVVRENAFRDATRRGLGRPRRLRHAEPLRKAEEFFDLERLRKALRADRRVSLRELLELVFGDIPDLKSREEVADEVFDRYDAEHPVDELPAIDDARDFARSYLLYPEFRVTGRREGLRLPQRRRARQASSAWGELPQRDTGYIKDRIDPCD